MRPHEYVALAMVAVALIVAARRMYKGEWRSAWQWSLAALVAFFAPAALDIASLIGATWDYRCCLGMFRS